MLPLRAVAFLLNVHRSAGERNDTGVSASSGRNGFTFVFTLKTGSCIHEKKYTSSSVTDSLLCSCPRSKKKVSPASRYHTATAHTVLTTLIRWVQLSQLMLSNLPNQCVEGILHSLSTQTHTQKGYRTIQALTMVNYKVEYTAYTSYNLQQTSQVCSPLRGLATSPWQPQSFQTPLIKKL